MLYEPARRSYSRHAPLRNIAHQLNALRRRPLRKGFCATAIVSVILFTCADATECRGGKRFCRSSPAPFRTTRTGVLDTTSLRHRSCPSSGEIPRSNIREASLIRWRLVPSWAKDSSKSAGMINARSETAASIIDRPTMTQNVQHRLKLLNLKRVSFRRSSVKIKPKGKKATSGSKALPSQTSELCGWPAIARFLRYAQFHRSPLGERRDARSSRGPERGCEPGRVESMVTTDLGRVGRCTCRYPRLRSLERLAGVSCCPEE